MHDCEQVAIPTQMVLLRVQYYMANISVRNNVWTSNIFQTFSGNVQMLLPIGSEVHADGTL